MCINYIINIILNRIIKYYKKSNKELKNRKGNVIRYEHGVLIKARGNNRSV